MTLTGFPDGAATFTRFDARTGRRIVGPVRVNRRGYSPLMVSSDGRRMVVIGDDGVTVRDAATLAVIERFGQGRLVSPDAVVAPLPDSLGPVRAQP